MGRKKRNSAQSSKQSPPPAPDSPPKKSSSGGAAGASYSGSSETKKAKTLEERRKEIEVQVAAARLLQQQLESSQTQKEEYRAGSSLDSSSGSGQRSSSRRKHGVTRKSGSTTDKSDRVRSYWNTMSIDKKKDLLSIRVSNLMFHFASAKDTSVNDVLSEALSFAEANKSWKFWICCRCSKKYSDSESHIQHVMKEHIGNLLPKIHRLMPQNVDNEWNDMILNCSWKPLDVSAAVKLLENQSKCKHSTFSENVEDSLQAFESSDCSKIAETDIPLADGWPISDDSKRAILLEKIHEVFNMLIRHKYLAASHVKDVTQFAIDQIQGLAAGSHILNHSVDLSPICICFLEAPQLEKILNFLQRLACVCDLGKSKSDNPMDNASEGPVIKEKIVLSGDASCLLLDDCLLTTEVTADNLKVAGIQDTFLSWIYSGSSSGDQLASWMRQKEDKIKQGMDVVQMLEKEFYHLQNLCEKKCERMSSEEALLTIHDLCLEEGKKRQQVTEYVPLGFESVLGKRREELTECAIDLICIVNRFELEAISDVLKEAEALNSNQSGHEAAYGGAASQLHDLESGEVAGCRKKHHSETERTLILGQTSQMDSHIEVAIRKLKENLLLELSEIDARIMRNLTKMKQQELRLELVSAYDYRAILLPPVKLYLRAYMEDLAEKDAIEKSEAATQAFLAELALDSKKDVKGGNDNTKEKTKDKKKKKEHRKSKAIGGQEQPKAPIPEKASCDQDGDDLEQQEEESKLKMEQEDAPHSFHQDSEINIPVDDDLEQQEEESKLLEKHLDMQRTIENQAEQQKKFSEEDLDEVVDKLQEAQLRTTAEGPDMHEVIPQVMDDDLKLLDQHTEDQGEDDEEETFQADLKKAVYESLETDMLMLSFAMRFVVNGTNTLKEDQVVDEEEETFQADLEKAVSESLETYKAHPKSPSDSSLRAPPRASPQADKGVPLDENRTKQGIWFGSIFVPTGLATGLKNEVGEYNCFLNVIIQSLWHLSSFREVFLRTSRSEHGHVGDPCVVCALYEIFTAMDTASRDSVKEPVAPNSLRKALSNVHPDKKLFQEAQMNDVPEVLQLLFDCLHQSFASVSAQSVEGNKTRSWGCDINCIAHSMFGMDIYQRMNCRTCDLCSRLFKYTAFFHNIHASALRTMKNMHRQSSLEQLLNHVVMDHQLTCAPEAKGCGNFNHMEYIMSNPPRVFITVIGWQNQFESADDIKATLATLNTEINISVLYSGLGPIRIHRLVSVVCFSGQHYRCFAYIRDQGQWVMCDDTTVKAVGGWTDVLSTCEKSLLQPQILFFEWCI